MDSTRRRLIAGLAAGVVTGVAGCTGGGGGGTTDDTPTNAGETADGGTTTRTPDPSLDGPVAGAPIPADPSSFTYATMGDADAPEVVYYGNWKCPYCAQFSTGAAQGLSLGEIVEDYVVPGDVRLTYRCLAYTGRGPFLGPDAPRAARAGLAVWNVEPGAYWPYHEYVMKNQPPEAKRWATKSKLVSFARAAGVDDLDAVRRQIGNGKYQSVVRDTTDAAGAAGVSGTPSLVANGQVVSPFKGAQARDLLDSL